jgi:hypothetical protein
VALAAEAALSATERSVVVFGVTPKFSSATP